MATKTRKTGLQATIDEQQDTLEQIGEIVSDALDPASTRAELVEALQQIDSLVNGEDEEDGDEGED